MLSANFKPKTTTAASRGFLATPSHIAVGADKKKRKERKGKVSRKVAKGLYFSDMGSIPPWTDFYLNWQG